MQGRVLAITVPHGAGRAPLVTAVLSRCEPTEIISTRNTDLTSKGKCVAEI